MTHDLKFGSGTQNFFCEIKAQRMCKFSYLKDFPASNIASIECFLCCILHYYMPESVCCVNITFSWTLQGKIIMF